ncbi:protein kinase domain-containing protein [Salirhabdus salicampi]|uniref:protein kinase domain-containing protein n=1 Tax=Salirhabdus salicampi TaxID=476102 RepID=UPI0020C22F48|nr:lipopolysaccharide kinase InaA family protein [Salirhabdus salicampi]MCP8617504.1 protein kinase [Salirhabdus salicampi]
MSFYKKARFFISLIKKKIIENTLSMNWYLKNGRDFQDYIEKKYELTGVKPLKFTSWHQGCKYFIGNKKNRNQKVFIKLDHGGMNAVHNETNAINILKNFDTEGNHLPSVLFHELEGSNPFVAFEFVKGKSLSQYIMDTSKKAEVKQDIVKQFVVIVQMLHNAGIIHRDIRMDNFIVRDEGPNKGPKLVLIDFAFAVSPGRRELLEIPNIPVQKKILKGLGNGANPAPFKWDDAYSICLLAERIDPNWAITCEAEYKFLNSLVGALSYTFNGDSNNKGVEE